ncbi:MAG: GNAT family N-acetyltransferase [Pirellulales bacterium]|nr:GNAT family N-acetyltransferase [Pirellulales bacterium]
MALTYFKRYRMETDLVGRDLSPIVPQGYRLLAWDPALLESHAQTKYLSFRNELDSNVFPCLGELTGCLRLMEEISSKPNFLPEATWLAARELSDDGRLEYCGTIQGIRARDGYGSIQNLGIVPVHRDRGVGTALLFRALQGFRQAGLRRVSLEVTVENDGAVRLYQRHGFVPVKTVFKAAEVVFS